MTLEFRPPFQIDPNAESPQSRSLARFNQTISDLGDSFAQRRQQKAMMDMQKAKEARERRVFEEEYGPEMPAGGMDPTAQFMQWKQSQEGGSATPQDDFSRMMAIPGSKRRSEAMGFLKSRKDQELQQSQINENNARADYWKGGGSAGAGGERVVWHLNPITGEREAYPTRMGGTGPAAVPKSMFGPRPSPTGGAPTPPMRVGTPEPGSTDPMAGLDYKTRIKLQKEKPKARASLTNTLREYDNMINEAKAIRDDSALGMASGATAFTSSIPGTPMKRVGSRLDTLKAKTLLNVLANLKELSSSGASGFGALSNIEGENIRNSISTLDSRQATPDLKASLNRFIDEMEQRKGTLRNAFTSTYGEMEGMGGAPATPNVGGAPQYQKTATNKATGERMGQLPDGTWVPIP